MVVSDKEKAVRNRQVSIAEMNASEPLMRCRNESDVVKTWYLARTRDKHRRKLDNGRRGNRHREGMNAIQA